MQLWQLDTIAVGNKEEALIALCEEQKSTIEDLRYLLSEAEEERDDADCERAVAEDQLEKVEKERDELQRKLGAIEAIVNEIKSLFV